MGHVLYHPILVLEAVIHFFIHVCVILPELTQCLGLDVLDTLLLAGELFIKLLCEFSLPLETTLLFSVDSIFNFICLLLQEL